MRTLISLFNRLNLWQKTAAYFFVGILLLLNLVTLLVATEPGSQVAINSLAHLFDIRISQMRGNLLTGLNFDSVDYQQDDMNFHAEHVSFRWQPIALLYTSVSVQSLSADHIRIHMPQAKKEREVEPFAWPNYSQPLRIELDKLQLRDITLVQADSRIHIDTIAGSFSVGAFQFQANKVQVENEQVKLGVTGKMDLRYPYATSATINWQMLEANVHAKGSANIQGDIRHFALEHKLQEPVLLTTTAKISPALHDKKNKPIAEINSVWAQQKIPVELQQLLAGVPVLSGELAQLNTQGSLNLSGWFDRYHVHAQTQSQTESTSIEFIVDAQGQYALPDDSLKASNLHVNNATLSTRNLQADAPALINEIHTQGDINFSPTISWDFALSGQHLNAAQFWQGWDSDFSIDLMTRGNLASTGAQLHATIEQLNLEGTLRNLKMHADGAVSFADGQLQSDGFKLAIGDNSFNAKGSAGKSLALEWKVNAPLLQQIDPHLGGSILSSGSIGGDLQHPQLQMTTKIHQLTWRDYAIDQLNITLKPLADERYSLQLDAAHVQWQDVRVSSVNVKANGNIEQNTIDARVDSPEYGRLDFSLDSAWQNDQWKGLWRQLNIAPKKVSAWHLSENSPLLASSSQFSIARLCLTSATDVNADSQSILAMRILQQSSLVDRFMDGITHTQSALSANAVQEMPVFCFSAQWNESEGFNSQGELRAFPLQQVRAWLKAEVAVGGVVDGKFTAQAAPKKNMHITGSLQTRAAQLTYQFQGGNVEVYPLHEGKLELVLNNNLLGVQTVLDWGNFGSSVADIKYGTTDQKILGNIAATFPDISPLESLVPFLDDIKGSVNANVHLAGTLDNPEFSGSLILANGSANVPRLGLGLSDIQLNLSSQIAGLIHVDGQVLSGDGHLMLRGDFDHFGTENWHWQGNIFGANIRMIQQPQLIANVSPNLVLSASAQSINLTGSTEIPWARAALKRLPESATKVSDDVIVVESKTALKMLAAQKKSIPFLSNVNLLLGEDVRFTGFGLDSQLSGKINVLKEENRQALTTGFVAVSQGKYKAYGQELSIERGRLIFQGPYDNPGLDIRALRVAETITAGLDIGGTLQKPKSSVFSIPATSDSEAMAILLTGKSLTQSSTADAYALMSAISGLGMEKGQSMTADIQKFFHIDEVGVKSGESLSQSSLWIGKYVTPKLLIRYVVGLFDQAFGIGVRYQLSEKFRIEATSGKNQSVDVIYKIER